MKFEDDPLKVSFWFLGANSTREALNDSSNVQENKDNVTAPSSITSVNEIKADVNVQNSNVTLSLKAISRGKKSFGRTNIQEVLPLRQFRNTEVKDGSSPKKVNLGSRVRRSQDENGTVQKTKKVTENVTREENSEQIWENEIVNIFRATNSRMKFTQRETFENKKKEKIATVNKDLNNSTKIKLKEKVETKTISKKDSKSIIRSHKEKSGMSQFSNYQYSRHIHRPVHVSDLSINDMILLKVPNEQFIPNQPRIGKIVELPDSLGYILVHYYTGTYDGKWYPMSVRNSPYLRQEKATNVLYKFHFTNDSTMTSRDKNEIKELQRKQK